MHSLRMKLGFTSSLLAFVLALLAPISALGQHDAALAQFEAAKRAAAANDLDQALRLADDAWIKAPSGSLLEDEIDRWRSLAPFEAAKRAADRGDVAQALQLADRAWIQARSGSTFEAEIDRWRQSLRRAGQKTTHATSASEQCHEAKVGIDWVLSGDAGALREYRQSRARGNLPIDAVLDAQRHNQRQLNAILECRSWGAAYIAATYPRDDGEAGAGPTEAGVFDDDACREARIGIDWVLAQDAGAMRVYRNAVSAGKFPIDAVLDAQTHNKRQWDAIARCRTWGAAYITRTYPGAPSGGSQRTQRDDEVTFIVKSMHENAVQLQFYSDDRERIWPQADRVYSLNDYEDHTYTLRCTPGQRVCYAAWVSGDTNSYWGLGFRGRQACARCCVRCGGTERFTLNPAAGSPPVADNSGGSGSEVFNMILGIGGMAVGTRRGGSTSSPPNPAPVTPSREVRRPSPPAPVYRSCPPGTPPGATACSAR